MSATSEINRKNNLRNQVNLQEQSGYIGDPYFNAARTSLQQSHRFVLRVRGIPFALITDVDRPTPKLGTVKNYQLLNWEFKFPTGIVGWNDISFKIRETFDNGVVDSVAGIVLNKIKILGYDTPRQVDANNLKDMNKSSLMESLGSVSLEMLKPDGSVYERWNLYGAFISSISFDKMNYSASSLIGASLKISYDWAELVYINNTGADKTY